MSAGPLNTSPLEPPRKDSTKASDDSPGSSFGVPQVAIGVLSLLLVGIFIATSGAGPGGVVNQPQSSQKVPYHPVNFILPSRTSLLCAINCLSHNLAPASHRSSAVHMIPFFLCLLYNFTRWMCLDCFQSPPQVQALRQLQLIT